MARRRNPLVQGALACLTLGFGGILRALPLSWSRAGAKFVGRLALRLLPRLHRVGRANLDLAYGDTLTPVEKNRILVEAVENLATVVAELPRLPMAASKDFRGFVTLEGLEHVDSSRGFLGISAHYSNWEWMCPVVAHHGFTISEVVRPFDHPWLHRKIDALRRSGGTGTIPKDNAGGELLQRLRKGEVIGLLADQSPRENGVPVTFFGQPCWATIAPVMIALRARVPVYPVSMRRAPDGRYTCRFHPAIEMVRTGDTLSDFTENSQRCQDALEAIIREAPGQWLWFHRRWKTRGRLENEWQEKCARAEKRRRPAEDCAGEAAALEYPSEPEPNERIVSSMLMLGSLCLGEIPRVAIAVRDDVSTSALRNAFSAGADLIEFRVDEFSRREPEHVLKVLAPFSGLPALGTIRAAAEGGRWDGPDADRLALYKAILPHVDAVDVELSSEAILPEVISAAQEAGRLVLGSYHDFHATPAPETLDALAKKADAHGVDILKVAAYCQSQADLQRLARFTLNQAARHCIVIGMGPLGALSRILFPALGSLITYTFLGAPTAPGQLNCEATLQYLEAFYPARIPTAAPGAMPEGGNEADVE